MSAVASSAVSWLMVSFSGGGGAWGGLGNLNSSLTTLLIEAPMRVAYEAAADKLILRNMEAIALFSS